jgi:hypothetical protein
MTLWLKLVALVSYAQKIMTLIRRSRSFGRLLREKLMKDETPQPKRRQTPEEIEEMLEWQTRDGHATAFGYHGAECECGLHPYPGRARFISAAEPLGPVGSETTPPFGVLKHAAERKAEKPKVEHDIPVVEESKEMRKYRLDAHAAVHAELLERDLREELGDEVYEQLYSED